MKKLEKLNIKIKKLEDKIHKVSFILKDSCYKNGKYFKTRTADLTNVVVISIKKKSDYLFHYVCISREHKYLAELYFSCLNEIKQEHERILRIENNKWIKNCRSEAINFVNKEIEDNTIFTPYCKRFFIGNKHIYLCSPLYGHEDYNKKRIMINTSSNRKLAYELNAKIDNLLNIKK